MLCNPTLRLVFEIEKRLNEWRFYDATNTANLF
jgi:hypothetical protein